jgi:hypothetical protein
MGSKGHRHGLFQGKVRKNMGQIGQEFEFGRYWIQTYHRIDLLGGHKYQQDIGT